MSELDRLLHLKIISLTKETLKEFEELKLKCVRSLKLQELVKERLKGAVKCGHKRFSDESGYLEQELQSMIEESEK